ncbi:MAG TPA: Rne/Rng family ribonuclease [Frankiaceae bacterium]|nr:Rne/Rng family ribonuclease [Frankiaceae bacterium]
MPETPPAAATRPRRRRAASRPVGAPAPEPAPVAAPPEEPAVETPAEAEAEVAEAEEAVVEAVAEELAAEIAEAETITEAAEEFVAEEVVAEEAAAEEVKPVRRSRRRAAPVVTFQAPDPLAVTFEAPRVDLDHADRPSSDDRDEARDQSGESESSDEASDEADDSGDSADGAPRRRRRRGRRGRGRVREDGTAEDGEQDGEQAEESGEAPAAKSDEAAATDGESSESGESGDSDEPGSAKRRRTRQRRPRKPAGSDDDEGSSSSGGRSSDDEIRGVSGSTRLEAKRQRRRESRDTSRRRVPLVTEAEFLARRESVNRVMVVRNAGERTQIAVLEDDVLVEHYVTRASSASYAGNVYLGRVQNVLPSMEAAFVDIGKGRNGVLYAGEVNYDASGLEGKPRKIEQALKAGQAVVVQVTKDPIGHKGARLTSQVSLPGRYMVYVPDGGSAGISRKLPDSERTRLRSILKKITPEDAGVIVRTAAEGASEDELSRDITRLAAQWEDIQKKSTKATPPGLLYAEPDLVVRVIRDIFNEDFNELVVQGDDEWELIHGYVSGVAPDLLPRLRQETLGDVFAESRIDEQLLKALDRKVYLPSGGSLVFDRTEAMTVVDVNTGRFTGKGGNLEETVTKNNLEAAEELVRQLRLRDVGGIIVVDFIDMVLESNRELVLRRLTECLGRDRTKHQVAEVTSLGLVQMTRKRVGQGLLEAYSEPCPTCGGRGHTIELPGLGGIKPKPKPIPRPPLPRPLDEDGNEIPAAPGDATTSENGVDAKPDEPTVAPEVEEAVEAIEAALPEEADVAEDAAESAEAHSADVLVE